VRETLNRFAIEASSNFDPSLSLPVAISSSTP
jgi:hypothetical protein